MISKIFPTTKLFMVIVTVIISLVLPWQFAYLFVLPVSLILALLDNKFKQYVKKLWIVLLLVLLIMFLFQLFLDKSTEHVYLNLGFMRVTLNGILNGLEQTKFILTLITLFLLFFETTDIEDLMIALQQKRVSHVTSYVIMATMTMIPEMIKKSSKIIKKHNKHVELKQQDPSKTERRRSSRHLDLWLYPHFQKLMKRQLHLKHVDLHLKMKKHVSRKSRKQLQTELFFTFSLHWLCWYWCGGLNNDRT